MSVRHLIIAGLCVTGLFAGCGKKTEAELAEMEREKLRGEKKVAAANAYRELAKKFPDHEKAKDASAKAATLEAQAKK